MNSWPKKRSGGAKDRKLFGWQRVIKTPSFFIIKPPKGEIEIR